MAVFNATGAFGPSAFDLHNMWRRTADTFFQNDSFLTYDGVTYRDSFSYNWFGPQQSPTTTIAGPSLLVNTSGGLPDLLGGTMTGLFEFVYKSWGTQMRFALSDFTANAAEFDAATLTVSRADDLAFFDKIFAGADTVTLSHYNDEFEGRGGNDLIYGRMGLDQLSGEGGHDVIFGGYGSDVLKGGGGNDRLLGNEGNDRLFGGAGGDVLGGGSGADRLIGGAGRDKIYAGADLATDMFVYRQVSDSPAGTGRDSLYLYDSGEDMIDLSRIDANSTVAGNQAFALSNTGAAAHSVWMTGYGGGMMLFADTDGDAKADFRIDLVGVFAFDLTDIIL